MHERLEHLTGIYVNTVEEWLKEPGWHGEVTQLSSGSLGHVVRPVNLGEVQLEWNSLTARAMIVDYYTSAWTTFLIQYAALAPRLHYAHPLGKDDAIVLSPKGDPEHRYVSPGQGSTLCIRVSGRAAEQRGWAARLPQRMRSGARGTSHLISVCKSATHTSLQQPAVKAQTAANVLTALEQTFSVQLLETEGSGEAVPDAAALEMRLRLLLGDGSEGNFVGVDALANQLGTSRRTLFRALRQWPGTTPARYLKILRLHAARRKLLAAPKYAGAVAAVAFECGFSHLGRFSSDYRCLFGELPSQTLLQ